MRFVYRNSIISLTMRAKKGRSTLTTHSVLSLKAPEIMMTSPNADTFHNKALKYPAWAFRKHRYARISLRWDKDEC